jgi:VIT1/CCC1 family predicted Fe2+/Mn2+ transporter
VHQRPGEAEAEIAYLLEADGLPRDEAIDVAARLAKHPEVMLKTMVEKELGLIVEPEEGSPMQGAVVMGAAFGLGVLPPLLPHLFLTGTAAVVASVVLTMGVLFGIGVVKSRWTHRSWWSSGLEILALGAFAGIAGYFFGNLLPTLVGVPEAAAGG